MKLNGFIGPTYSLRTLNYEAQRTINVFPELDELGTGKEREVAMLCDVPGLTLIHTIPRSPIRGIYYTSNGFIYVVAGNGLYNLVTTDGINYTHTLMAYLQTSTGIVSIVDGVPNEYNGIANTGLINQVVCVDGSTTGLVWQEGTTSVTQMNSSSGYQGSQFVTFQDGYFLFSSPGTISGYYAADPLNINDLDVINANLLSDNISRIISDHDIVWIFGNRTLSVWQNTGGSGTSNIFQQIPGAAAEGGCNAPYTIAKISGQLLWTTNDDRGYGMVSMAMGYRGARISNFAVEDWLQGIGDISQAVAWTYQDQGHSFYCLNAPGSTTTWCFDLTTKMWSERAYFSNGEYSRDLVNTHANVYQPGIGPVHMVGDFQNGNLYKLDNSNHTHNGNLIKRMRTAPHMSNGLQRVFYSQLQLDMQTGVGLDGLGFNVQQGYTGVLTHAVASGVKLVGNGPIYTLVGNDGLPAQSVTGLTLTASVPYTLSGTNPNWSNNYSFQSSNNTVTVIGGTEIVQSETTLGSGNGIQTNYILPGVFNAGPVNINVWLTDWRGHNLQQIYPAVNENLCLSSSDFNYGGLWSIYGANPVPSSWAVVESIIATSAYRPTSSTTNNLTVTNPANAYSASGTTISTSGLSATASLSGSGTLTTGSITYTGWSAGQFSGTLNLSGVFEGPSLEGLPILISYTVDGGSNIQCLTWDGQSQTILTTNITAKNLATLSVTITLQAQDSFPASLTLYDIVLLNGSLNFGASINTPDGNATGTFLTEDTSNGVHEIVTNYSNFTTSLGNDQTTGFSVYALAGDPNRYLYMQLGPGNGVALPISYAVFNLVAGTVVSYSTNTVIPTIDPVPGNPGVYRCWLSYLESLKLTPGTATIALSNVGVGTSYNGNGLSCIGIWGAQIDNHGDSNSPMPLIQTSGETAEDYVTFTATDASMEFNIAPFAEITNTSGTVTTPAASISYAFDSYSPQLYPTEYLASFSYEQQTPNYVAVGTNPQVALSYSDDGGYTFSPERYVSMGKIGDRFRRAIWRKLGMSRDRVFRITCSDPVKFEPIGCEIMTSGLGQ